MHYSIDITTEQSSRYIELTDAKIWISKMCHYVGFCKSGHIRTYMYNTLIEYTRYVTYYM